MHRIRVILKKKKRTVKERCFLVGMISYCQEDPHALFRRRREVAVAGVSEWLM